MTPRCCGSQLDRRSPALRASRPSKWRWCCRRRALLVLAGAGSGKTRASPIASLFLGAWGCAGAPAAGDLHESNGAQPASSLAQLGWSRSRVDRDALWLGTFHHLALRVLRQHGHRIGLSDRFVVLDRGESADLIAACMDEVAVSRERPWPRPAQLQSLLALDEQRDHARADARPAGPELMDSVSPLSQVYERYTARKLRMACATSTICCSAGAFCFRDQRVVRDEQRGRPAPLRR